jgi:multiple sugar transport system permease protein
MAANIADTGIAEEIARGVRTIDHLPPSFNRQPARVYLLWLMLPAILLLAAISLYPFVWLIYMSLHEVQIAPGKSDIWVGIDNFTRLVNDKKFATGWVTLFKYSALCLSIEIGLGVLVAVILNNSRFEKILVTIFLMPMMMAPVIAGFLFMFLYNGTFGWYFWLLKSLGILEGGSILGDRFWAMFAVVATDVWQWTPLIALITLAGLKRVPQDQLEAHMVDGAGEIRNFTSGSSTPS